MKVRRSASLSTGGAGRPSGLQTESVSGPGAPLPSRSSHRTQDPLLPRWTGTGWGFSSIPSPGFFQMEWRESGRRLTRFASTATCGARSARPTKVAAGIAGPEMNSRKDAEPEPPTLETLFEGYREGVTPAKQGRSRMRDDDADPGRVRSRVEHGAAGLADRPSPVCGPILRTPFFARLLIPSLS